MGHAIVLVFAKILVPLFFLGLLGSAIVIVVTTVHDLSEVWTSDDDNVSDL